MTEDRIEERVAVLERKVADLKRKLGSASRSAERSGIVAEAREQVTRVKERSDHVYARAHELGGHGKMVAQKARQTHRAQEELEKGALGSARGRGDEQEGGAGV